MRWLAIILVVQFAFHFEPVTASAQEEALEVISGFLKSLTKGKKRKRGRKVVDAPAAGAYAEPVRGRAVNPAKLERDNRKLRLENHFKAYAGWVDHVCQLSDEQKKELEKLLEQKIGLSQKKFGEKKIPQNHRNYLFDYSPFRFFDDDGAATEIYKADLEKAVHQLLNEKQIESLIAATSQRKQQLHNRYLNYIMEKADKELFLSEKQEKQIRDLFPDQIPLLENGLYTFIPRTYYVKEKPIASIVMHPPVAFKRVQMNRLQDLKQRRSSLTFMANNGVESWYKQLDEEVENQKEKFQRALDIRIAFIGTEFQLSPQDKKYLKLAGKGATLRVLTAWKKRSLPQLKSWEKHVARQPGQNFGFGLQAADVSELDKNPLWEHAVKKVVTEATYNKIMQRAQQAKAGYLVAILDSELYLRDDQCDEIQTILQGNLPVINTRNSQSYDLALLGLTIHGKKRKAIEKILTEPQLNAFSALKRQFTVQNSYLGIQSRHGQMYLHPLNQ